MERWVFLCKITEKHFKDRYFFKENVMHYDDVDVRGFVKLSVIFYFTCMRLLLSYRHFFVSTRPKPMSIIDELIIIK
jgi:hypothetical protein